MEFGIETFGIFIMKKKKKRKTSKEKELPKQELMKTLGEKRNFFYLGIFEADTINQRKMKDNIRKKYLKRTRKRLEIQLGGKKPYQKNKYLSSVPCKIHSTLPKMNREGIKRDGL